MKTKPRCLAAFPMLALLLTINSQLSTLHAQGTAFTYQGRLNANGGPANGSYNLQFSLFDAMTSGSQVGVTVTNPAVGITNGLFTTTLDFGSGIFTGNPLWLQIAVETNGASGYTTLSPLQPITPAPYSILAESAESANTVLSSSVSAAQLNTPAAPNNGQVLTFNGGSLVWASGGGTQNTASGVGDTISGGTGNNASQFYSTVSGGIDNTASGIDSTVPGGVDNVAAGTWSFAAGAGANANNTGAFVWADGSGGSFASTANNQFNVRALGGVRFVTGGAGMSIDGVPVSTGGGGGGSNLNLTISMVQTTNSGPYSSAIGYNNTAAGNYSSVGGGVNNTANGEATTVSGGLENQAVNFGDTVPGGAQNVASGGNSFAAGTYAEALNSGSFVWADNEGTPFTSSANNQFDVRANGGIRLVTGGNGTTGLTLDGYEVLTTATGGGGGGGSGWNLTGNAGTTPGVNFLGTTDGSELVFKADNVEGLRLTPSQNLVLQRPSEFSDFSERNGLGVYGFTFASDTGSRTFANQNVLGPVLFGEAGGGLGVINSANLQTLALNWSAFGVSVNLPTTIAANTTINGTAAVNGNASITGTNLFGAQTRQMIDLYDSGIYDYGIGVQTATFYERAGTGGGFAWYSGGVHNDNQDNNGGGTTLMTLDGSGDLTVTANASVCSLTIRGGCDLAEPFQISSDEQEIPQGTVVVIDEANPGRLKMSDQPYDTRVAGIVSGANGINPGIQMQQQGLLEGGKNVALSGRVYVQADASNGAIRPGDLLTTSSSPGRAMKVTDHAKSQGAILGKAMTGLKEGQGMVLVLVTLQ